MNGRGGQNKLGVGILEKALNSYTRTEVLR